MHPVKATAVGSDTYTFRNRHVFAVDVDAEMGVNMVGALLHTITTDTVDRWIEGVGVDYSLYLQEGKTNEAQEKDSASNGTPEGKANTLPPFASFYTSLATSLTKFFLFRIRAWNKLLAAHVGFHII